MSICPPQQTRSCSAARCHRYLLRAQKQKDIVPLHVMPWIPRRKIYQVQSLLILFPKILPLSHPTVLHILLLTLLSFRSVILQSSKLSILVQPLFSKMLPNVTHRTDTPLTSHHPPSLALVTPMLLLHFISFAGLPVLALVTDPLPAQLPLCFNTERYI